MESRRWRLGWALAASSALLLASLACFVAALPWVCAESGARACWRRGLSRSRGCPSWGQCFERAVDARVDGLDRWFLRWGQPIVDKRARLALTLLKEQAGAPSGRVGFCEWLGANPVALTRALISGPRRPSQGGAEWFLEPWMDPWALRPMGLFGMLSSFHWPWRTPWEAWGEALAQAPWTESDALAGLRWGALAQARELSLCCQECPMAAPKGAAPDGARELPRLKDRAKGRL